MNQLAGQGRMNKIKSILSPGHSADDEIMYQPHGHSSRKASSSKKPAGTESTSQAVDSGDNKRQEVRSRTTEANRDTQQEQARSTESQGSTPGLAAAGATSVTTQSSSSQLAPTTQRNDNFSAASIKSGVAGAPADQPSSVSQSTMPLTTQDGRYGNDTTSTDAASAGVAGESGVDRSARPQEQTAEDSFGKESHDGYVHVLPSTTARKFSLGGAKRPENTDFLNSDHEQRSPSSGPDGRRGLASAAAAASGSGVYGSSGNYPQGHSNPKNDHQMSSHQQYNPSAAVAAQTAMKEYSHSSSPQQNNHGRDAALAGAGAATAAGLAHESKQDNISSAEEVGRNNNNKTLKDLGAGSAESPSEPTASSSQPDDGSATDATNTMAAEEPKARKPEEFTDRGTLSDMRSKSYTGGWNNPYASSALDPRVGGMSMPGGFPATPGEELDEPKHGKGKDSSLEGGATDTSVGTQSATDDQEQNTSRDIAHEQPERELEEHDHGSDAAMAAGVGAAGLGAYKASEWRNEPASVDENYLDRSKSDEIAANTKHNENRASDAAAEQWPLKDDRHHGRDAAAASGAGSVGPGASEASKPTLEEQPPKSTSELYGAEVTKPHLHHPTTAATAGGVEHDSATGDTGANPAAQQGSGYDAANLGGGAATAAVAGAYGGSKLTKKHRDSNSGGTSVYPDELRQPHHHQPTTADTAGGIGADSGTGDEHPRQQPQPGAQHQGHATAAMAGTAGAASAVGAFEAQKQYWDGQAPATSRELYGEDIARPHQHSPTSARTAGGVQPDSISGEDASQRPRNQGYKSQIREHLDDSSSSNFHESGASVPAVSGAVGSGVAGHDYADDHPPTDEQRDPVAAIQAATSRRYEDQLANPTHHGQEFDPVRGDILPNQREPTAYSSQPDQHYYGREAALAGGGAAAASAGAYEMHGDNGNHNVESPMTPQNTYDGQQPPSHAQSMSSSKHSDEGSGGGSPKQKKHRFTSILHRKNRSQDLGKEAKRDQEQQQRFSGDKSRGSPAQGAAMPIGDHVYNENNGSGQWLGGRDVGPESAQPFYGANSAYDSGVYGTSSSGQLNQTGGESTEGSPAGGAKGGSKSKHPMGRNKLHKEMPTSMRDSQHGQ